MYAGDKCEHAGELVQLHLDADFDTVDSAFLDDAGAMCARGRKAAFHVFCIACADRRSLATILCVFVCAWREVSYGAAVAIFN